MTKILGISAYFHDSAAAIVVDGKVLAAAQEERFSREKHTAVFPEKAIKYCLNETGFCIDELDAVVFYDKPMLKFERLLETYYAFSPKGIISFLKAIPVWLNEKLFFKNQLYSGLSEVGPYNKKKLKLLFSEHHISHAASAFYTSNFEESAILTVDGVGEWCTASIGYGKGENLSIEKELNFPHSVGLLYSAFTYYLGFKVNSGEYKLMGLAPYGSVKSAQIEQYKQLMKNNLVDIKNDGSIWLNQSYFDYATGLKMAENKKWEELFGFSRRQPDEKIEQNHCDLALAIQEVTEEIILKMAKEARHTTGSENLCMAGGVALNCVSNGKLLKSNIFKNIYVQPSSGDAGGALGAALAVSYLFFEDKRDIVLENESINGTYLGPSFSNKEVLLMSKKVKAIYKKYKSFDDLTKNIATKISEGKVVGWFQGRMEFGPRALGNRSILASSSFPEMQKKINLKIKKREGFRPFAPAILDEDASVIFELKQKSPYMLFVTHLKEKYRKLLPDDFNNLSSSKKLNHPRSEWQAVTHVDFSSRVQTVNKSTNKRFWKLLKEVKKTTGIGMVVNTSFNVRGEPIVCTPTDAYNCFMNTDMDYLVINNFLYKKQDQKDWDKTTKWELNFKKD